MPRGAGVCLEQDGEGPEQMKGPQGCGVGAPWKRVGCWDVLVSPAICFSYFSTTRSFWLPFFLMLMFSLPTVQDERWILQAQRGSEPCPRPTDSSPSLGPLGSPTNPPEAAASSWCPLNLFCALQVFGVHLNKWQLDKKLGCGCLLLYGVFLCFSIMTEFNVFTFVNLPMCGDH